MTFFAGLKGSAGYQYFPIRHASAVGNRRSEVCSVRNLDRDISCRISCGRAADSCVTHDNPLTNVIAFGAASIIDPTQFRVNAIAINADTFTMAPGYNLTLRWFAIGS
jgi:hypothetical protein